MTNHPGRQRMRALRLASSAVGAAALLLLLLLATGGTAFQVLKVRGTPLWPPYTQSNAPKP